MHTNRRNIAEFQRRWECEKTTLLEREHKSPRGVFSLSSPEADQINFHRCSLSKISNFSTFSLKSAQNIAKHWLFPRHNYAELANFDYFAMIWHFFSDHVIRKPYAHCNIVPGSQWKTIQVKKEDGARKNRCVIFDVSFGLSIRDYLSAYKRIVQWKPSFIQPWSVMIPPLGARALHEKPKPENICRCNFKRTLSISLDSIRSVYRR